MRVNGAVVIIIFLSILMYYPAVTLPAAEEAPSAEETPVPTTPAPAPATPAPAPETPALAPATPAPAPETQAPAPEAQAPAPATPAPAPGPGTPALTPETQISVAPAATAPASEVGGPASEFIKKGETLDLKRCIEIALINNQNVAVSANTVHAFESRIGQARSAYYPQLNASASYNRLSGINIPGAKPFNQYLAGVNVTQNIYDFGRTGSQVGNAKYNAEASRSDLENTSDVVVLNVKQAYFGVLQAKRNRDVAAQVVKQFQLHLDQATGFYQVGTRPRIDVTKAEVDLSNAQLSLIRAENSLKVSWVVLNNALGVPNAPEYAIEDNLQFQKYMVTFDEAIERAYRNRPDLKAILARESALQENIRFARAGYFPFLTGNAGYNFGGQQLPLDHGWNFGVSLTVPLFSGFLTKYQVNEASSNLDTQKSNEELLRQQILLEIQQSFLNLKEAEDSISTAELAVKQADENLALANGRYAAGVGNPIEVTDAFSAYTNAQANYTNALYTYKVAQASIEKAMGVGAEVPGK